MVFGGPSYASVLQKTSIRKSGGEEGAAGDFFVCKQRVKIASKIRSIG